MIYKDTVGGVTENFGLELDASRRKYATLLREKAAAEATHEGKLEAMRGGNSGELASRN